jgi:ribonucleoside-diphosphate reductase alpha chain
MSTSVIDYVFRDLAISYLKRSDLGQVKPEDLVATATNSDTEVPGTKPRGEKNSAGFRPSATVSSPPASGKSSVKQQGSSGSGSTKALGTSAFSPQSVAPQAQTQVAVFDESYPEESEVIKIVQARIKGYEGDPCSSCGSFTLLRNGTCMKCDTCGGTTGCS